MQTNKYKVIKARARAMLNGAASRATSSGLVMALLSSPAFAQLSGVNAKLSMIQMLLVSIGGVTASIAILWAAYKMMFQAAKWGEISNVVIGGVLAGSAVAFGAWVVS